MSKFLKFSPKSGGGWEIIRNHYCYQKKHYLPSSFVAIPDSSANQNLKCCGKSRFEEQSAIARQNIIVSDADIKGISLGKSLRARAARTIIAHAQWNAE